MKNHKLTVRSQATVRLTAKALAEVRGGRKIKTGEAR